MSLPTVNADGHVGIGFEGSADRALLGAFAVCTFAWALDFKASVSGGGAAIQGAMLGVYAIGSFYIAISALRRGIGAGPLWLLTAATLLFVIEASVVGLLNDQEAYAITVNAIPALIYVCSATITYMTLTSSRENSRPFLSMVRNACLVFVVVHVAIVIVTRGSINLSDSRFEVLSAATIPALAIIAIGFIMRLSRLDVAASLLNLLVSLISVTRTLLFVLLVQIMSVILVRPSSVLKPSTIKGMSVLGASLLVLLTLDLGVGTGLTARWFQRMTVSHAAGADPTSLTRKAEVFFMMDSFTSSTGSVLFGSGLAAPTSLIGPDARLAARIVGAQSVAIHSVGYGHENYVSVLFIAGLLGGGGLLFMQFLNGFQALAFIRRLDLNQLDEPEARLGVWGGLIVIGTLAAGFFGGILSDRGMASWYGIGTGMLYWARGIMANPTAAGARQ